MHQKLFSDPILILVNKTKQQLEAENSLNTRYLERGFSESLKNLTLFFLLSLVLFNGQDYEKQKGPGTNDQLLFRLRSRSRKIPLLVMYYLTILMM